MKKTWILLSLLALGLSSCKNNPKQAGETNGTEGLTLEKPAPILELACYSYTKDNNLISLEITDLGEVVTANLIYALDGKDRNEGTFQGKLSGDKLIGAYTFMSEGVESKREVAFQIVGNQFIEGYGELKEQGTAFVDPDKLSYTSTMPLTKTDCDR